jgi:hypothetical protein
VRDGKQVNFPLSSFFSLPPVFASYDVVTRQTFVVLGGRHSGIIAELDETSGNIRNKVPVSGKKGVEGRER